MFLVCSVFLDTERAAAGPVAEYLRIRAANLLRYLVYGNKENIVIANNGLQTARTSETTEDVLFAVTHLLPAVLDAWAAWLRSGERGSVRFRSLVGECEQAQLATLVCACAVHMTQPHSCKARCSSASLALGLEQLQLPCEACEVAA